MNILIYFDVVNVAYSNPPGKRPTFWPFCIRRLRFDGSTACTPHNLNNSPVIGMLRMNLLPKPTIRDSASCF